MREENKIEIEFSSQQEQLNFLVAEIVKMSNWQGRADIKLDKIVEEMSEQERRINYIYKHNLDPHRIPSDNCKQMITQIKLDTIQNIEDKLRNEYYKKERIREKMKELKECVQKRLPEWLDDNSIKKRANFAHLLTIGRNLIFIIGAIVSIILFLYK